MCMPHPSSHILSMCTWDAGVTRATMLDVVPQCKVNTLAIVIL